VLSQPIRILIADDHPIVRDGLRLLLEAEADFVVAGEASNGLEALRATQELAPDLLLLDVMMPGVPSLDVLGALTAGAVPTRTLLLSANIHADEVVNAVRLGARGIVSKDSPPHLLMKAIRAVMAGQYWIGRESVSELVESLRMHNVDAKKRRFGLTARELEIATAVTSGYTNGEIARRLAISGETVKHHLTKIYGKIGVSGRLELALFAISHDLVRSSSDATARHKSAVPATSRSHEKPNARKR
jgi:two-component system nitrate/nitrite response regulator NarL